MMTTKIRVYCPTCCQSVVWDNQHTYKPFCSERCKLIDLGAWATEQHSIAGDNVIDEMMDVGDLFNS